MSYLIDLTNALVILTNFILIPGLTYGCQLALGALGINMIYNTMRFANFAHGEMMSFATMNTIFMTWWLQSQGIGIYPLPTALLALPIGLASLILYTLTADYLVFRHYRRIRAKPEIMLIASIGLLAFTGGLLRFIIGPHDQVFLDGARFIITAGDFKAMTGLDEGIAIKTTQVLTVVITFVMCGFLFWFLKSTRTGKSMRAYSNNEDLARLSGISPQRVVVVAWCLVAFLVTLAGVLYGLDKSFKPFTYFNLTLPFFAAAIVGGVGNPVGAIGGGFIIAYSELIVTFAYKRVLGYVLPETLTPSGLVQFLTTDYKIPLSFFILVIVLIIRPTGFFGSKIRLS